MGLEIGVYNVPSICTCVGSYSYVHTLRKIFIVAAIKWSEENNHDDVKEYLESWISRKSLHCNVIFYDKLPQYCPERFNELDIAGLYWFVYHSDNRGGWSVGQCNDIVFFYHMMIENDCLESTKENRLGEIMNIFEAACLLRKPVTCF